MDIKSILAQNKSNIALVIGNGINRYNTDSTNNSWDDLLQEISKIHSLHNGKIPNGIALTEFFDLLGLKSGQELSKNNLKKDFCELMSEWKPEIHHKKITEWSMHNNSPILTTNFDNSLGNAANCELKKITRDNKRSSDFYPWNSYYGFTDLDDPCTGFGIWHVNGMQYYKRSIRLGLTDYMGSVQHVRKRIRGKSAEGLSDSNSWRGGNTWLHIVFNMPLLFFGLGLDENEVFLRWLLIERAYYFHKFRNRRRSAWYVYKDDVPSSGKLFFLKGIGVEPVKVECFDDIYGPATWQL